TIQGERSAFSPGGNMLLSEVAYGGYSCSDGQMITVTYLQRSVWIISQPVEALRSMVDGLTMTRDTIYFFNRDIPLPQAIENYLSVNSRCDRVEKSKMLKVDGFFTKYSLKFCRSE